MTADASDLYADREQTLVKHTILKKYLAAFARIIGFGWQSVTYVDCFSGPWSSHSAALADTSPGIAIKELRDAQAWLKARKRVLHLNSLFIEEDPGAFAKLKGFLIEQKDIRASALPRRFEDSALEIQKFIRQSGQRNFTFFFIDPTGWKSIAIPTLEPLLKVRPSEVLINFMTSHVRRWVFTEGLGFDKIFVRSDYKNALAGLSGIDLDDAMTSLYADEIAAAGDFKFTSRAVVLSPTKDSEHYSLIYASRKPKGFEVFKDVERTSMIEMEQLRASAHQRKRLTRSGQSELFPAAAMHQSRYFNSLRSRYIGQATAAILREIKLKGGLNLFDAMEIATRFPLVWKPDIREWKDETAAAGGIQLSGDMKNPLLQLA